MKHNHPENYKQQITLGMSFLLIGMSLQKIGIFIPRLFPGTISLPPFVQGMLAGMGTIFLGASIYFNVRGVRNRQANKSDNNTPETRT